jgi:hypothetical protein
MLGAGAMGSRWTREVWQPFGDRMEFAGLVDPSPAALHEAGDWLGLPPAARFTDVREAFARIDADFCCIVTPPVHHQEALELAYACGMDILSEKPMADTPIWRYIDFAKLVDMLERRALHFSQLASLGDPFEGMPSDATLEQERESLEQFRQSVVASDERWSNVDWPRVSPASDYQFFQLSTYVNCWHMNEYESMAMWRVYSRDGIAIRSSFRMLTDCVRDVPHEIMARQVIYRDRRDQSQLELPGDTIGAAFRKGMSYEYEREIRAMILFTPGPPRPMSREEVERVQPMGLNVVPVDLDVLIDAVYVAPGRPPWFRELVGRVMRTYRLDKPLENSGLDDRPDLT